MSKSESEKRPEIAPLTYEEKLKILGEKSEIIIDSLNGKIPSDLTIISIKETDIVSKEIIPIIIFYDNKSGRINYRPLLDPQGKYQKLSVELLWSTINPDEQQEILLDKLAIDDSHRLQILFPHVLDNQFLQIIKEFNINRILGLYSTGPSSPEENLGVPPRGRQNIQPEWFGWGIDSQILELASRLPQDSIKKEEKEELYRLCYLAIQAKIAHQLLSTKKSIPRKIPDVFNAMGYKEDEARYFPQQYGSNNPDIISFFGYLIIN